MRAIVCGGRNFTDSLFLFREMDRIHAQRLITMVIEGGQRTRDPRMGLIGGADYWAMMWARSRGIECITEEARWDDVDHPYATVKVRADGTKYDASAGPRRNQRMIDLFAPEVVVVFPGGAGTRDMVTRAYEAGVEVIGAHP